LPAAGATQAICACTFVIAYVKQKNPSIRKFIIKTKIAMDILYKTKQELLNELKELKEAYKHNGRVLQNPNLVRG
jgi:predicted choloylglycine hydrolase